MNVLVPDDNLTKQKYTIIFQVHPEAKVDTFYFLTLSDILGRIGGLYSMLTLLTGISLMYITRKHYLENIAI
jgi:hypothetical protein